MEEKGILQDYLFLHIGSLANLNVHVGDLSSEGLSEPASGYVGCAVWFSMRRH